MQQRFQRLAKRAGLGARLLGATWTLLGASSGTSCSKHEEPSAGPPPPPPVASQGAGAGSGASDVCADGGGTDPDGISTPFVPRSAGGFCLDPQGEPKTYGDKGKFSMDDVCTTAFDGECEVYKRFDLDRVVVLRYVDGSGAPNSVEVNLSRFKTVDGAYAMFTKRVVADGDPARATVKPLQAGAAAASSSSNAYVWRGQYLVELTFVTEDAKMTPEAMARANELSTGAIARDVGGRLPGAAELPGPAALLPAAARIPLGVSYVPKDALGLRAIGPVAFGYYKDGEKRWRGVAVSKDLDGAREVFRAFRLRPGASAVKGIGDEAVQIVVQEAPERAKAEYVVARKGMIVAGIGDEEIVLDPTTPAEKLAPLRLTRDEKMAKLATWISGLK